MDYDRQANLDRAAEDQRRERARENREWEPFLSALHRGEPFTCTAEQWHNGLRTAVQTYAGRLIDQGQAPYAFIALEEVRRQDAQHGATAGPEREPR